MKNVDELRSSKVAELERELREQRGAYFKIKVQRGAGQFRETHRYREMRRGIARLKTIMAEKIAAEGDAT